MVPPAARLGPTVRPMRCGGGRPRVPARPPVEPPRSGRVAYRGAVSAEPAEAFPEVVEIVVEIPRGSRNKYEYDEEAHVFRLDRVLSSAIFYLEQVRPHRLVEIENFFRTYKLLEKKETDVVGWRVREQAHGVLRADRAAWEREQAG